MVGELKRRLVVLVAALIVGHGCVVAADGEAVNKEFAALQGRWEFQSGGAQGPGFEAASALIYGGRTGIDQGLEPYALEVNGDTFTFAGTPAGKTTARLDPTSNPKRINLTDAKGRTWFGVYELTDTQLEILLSFNRTRPIPVRLEGSPFLSSRTPHGHAAYKRGAK